MRVSEVTIEWLQERLEGWEGSGGQYAAWCPCHADIGTSVKGLSITDTGTKILAKCHSCGATLTAVKDQLEREGYDSDLKVNVTKISKNGAVPKAASPLGKGLKWWSEYTQVPIHVWKELGCTVFEDGVAFRFEGIESFKVRKAPKEIMWLPKNAPNPPLWPVPPTTLPSHVWITEGESDCGTARAAGHTAFTVTKGAKTDMPATWAEEFKTRGVKEITICTDTDEPGLAMRRMLEKAVVDAGLVCHVLHLDLVLDPFLGENDLNALWILHEGNLERFSYDVERCTQTVSSRFPVMTYEEAEEGANEEMEWVITGLVSPGDKILMSGPQKSYKTWGMLDLARCFADGGYFLGRQEWVCLKPQKVLVVQEEGGKQRWQQRITRLKLKLKRNFITLHKKGIRFTDSSTIDTIISICREHEIGAVFFDPLQRMMPGVDENDSSATGVVWDEVFRLQFALPHLIVVVVHHANKTDRLTWESVRGSSRHAGEVDLGIFFHKMDENKVRIGVDGRDIPAYLGTGESFEAIVEISGEGEKPHFKIDAGERIHVNVNPVREMAMKNKDAVLIAIADGCTTQASVVSTVEASENTIRKYIGQLVAEGKVIETDNGLGKAKTYAVADELEETDA